MMVSIPIMTQLVGDPMPTFKVFWEIDIEADTPVEAAQKALEIQRDEESIATVFTVVNEDLGVCVDVDFLIPGFPTVN